MESIPPETFNPTGTSAFKFDLIAFLVCLSDSSIISFSLIFGILKILSFKLYHFSIFFELFNKSNVYIQPGFNENIF